MKKNAQLLATLTFPVLESQVAFVTTIAARTILPNTTDGGLRSLLHHLAKAGVFSQEKLQKEVRYYLTDDGAEQLKAVFPALDARWDTYAGEWECIVFQEAPNSDPQFRYLRSQLVAERAIQLSRGVYCVPGSLSDVVSVLCKKMYRDSVSIFSVGSWKLGFERSTVIRNLSLGDLSTAYSSISREVDQLLAVLAAQGSLTDQHIGTFLSACDRFRDTVQEDTGILAYYYPNGATARSVLAQLQQVFLGIVGVV
jgi:DNA-binding transcriptional regulator PaaX